jgi:uncharacterized repeat protein (TIGR01451 family)
MRIFMNFSHSSQRWALQTACSLFLLVSATGPALSQSNGAQAASQNTGVSVTHIAEIETQVTLPDGKKEVRRMPAAKVEPGKVVVYTTRVQNAGKEPATQLSLVAPVPAHTTLVENASFGEAATTYSIDQGKSFAPLAQLVVDREGRQRPARSSDVTHLRWQPEKPLAPGAKLEMGFKVQVN